MPVTISKTGSGLAGLQAKLNKIRRSDVLVGIPADHAQRQGDGINNSSLLFIHTHGSPLNNIPARPVLEPAIEKAKALIAPELAAAAKAVLDRNPAEATKRLNRAGMIASNAAKRYFTDPSNGWAPNAPSTVKAKGSSKPLIDTGQLRRAITYVVREGDVQTPEESHAHEQVKTPQARNQADHGEAVTIGGEAAEVAEGIAEVL